MWFKNLQVYPLRLISPPLMTWLYDAASMIESASKYHAITCKILVGAVCQGGDGA